MLVFILAESALEVIPQEIWGHPSVKSYQERREKPLRKLFLDRSYHHAAMLKISNAEKRGRPDIAYMNLLTVLGSPLNLEGFMETYVHTVDDHVIRIKPLTRLPRNYDRFISLMEQLFEKNQVPETGEPLLTLRKETLPQLLQSLRPDHIVAFTRLGKPKNVEKTVSTLTDFNRPAVLIGGFPHGHLSRTNFQLADENICVDSEMLDSWIVSGRIIYEYERAMNLPDKRLQKGKE